MHNLTQGCNFDQPAVAICDTIFAGCFYAECEQGLMRDDMRIGLETS